MQKAVLSSSCTPLALSFPVDLRLVRLLAHSALLSSRACLRQTRAALRIKHVKMRLFEGRMDVAFASPILRFDALWFFLFIGIRQLRKIRLGRRGSFGLQRLGDDLDARKVMR